MGGVEVEVSAWDETRDEDNRDSGDLNVKSKVSPDGYEVILDLARGDRPAYSTSLTFGDGCVLYHELRVSLLLAKRRQKMTINLAKKAIADLLRTALRPEAIGFQIDPETGDIFIVYLFEQHAPFAVMVSEAQFQSAIAELHNLRKKKAN